MGLRVWAFWQALTAIVHKNNMGKEAHRDMYVCKLDRKDVE